MSFSSKRVASAYLNKTAASGMFGFTKAEQRIVESAISKIQKKSESISRSLEDKYPETGSYLLLRCNNANCVASKVLSKSCVFNKEPKRVLSGPMGFKPSSVKASHKALTDIIMYAGDVAHGLYSREKDYLPFLTTYVKRKRCPYAKLLLQNYPVRIES